MCTLLTQLDNDRGTMQKTSKGLLFPTLSKHIEKPCKMNWCRKEVGLSRSHYFTAVVVDNPTEVKTNNTLKDGLCYYITTLGRNGSVVGMYLSTHFLLKHPVSNGLILLCILLSAGEEGKHNRKHTSSSDSCINPILIIIADLEDKVSLGISKIPILYTVTF